MTVDLWTLAFQTVNVLVLLALLGRFFFKPVAAMVAKRKDEIAARLAEADAARDEAGRLKAEREAALVGVADERARMMAAAESDVARHRAGLLAAAEAEAERIRAAGRAGVEDERRTARREVETHAAHLAITIATRLVERIPAEALAEAFLSGLTGEIGALSPDQRSRLAAHPLTVRSAAPPTPELAAAVKSALAAALGRATDVTLVHDPDLMAGFELAAPGLLVRNSWQADLTLITKEIAGERAH